MMHTSKKLTQVSQLSTGELELYFKDGSAEIVDALIGADGIHGYVREYVLGADHPATKPSFGGFWDCRALVPIERAREALGEEYFREARQYGWTGDGGFIMHDVLDNGETVQCVAAAVSEDWDPAQWKKDLDRKKLEDAFSSWTNSPVVEGMITVRSREIFSSGFLTDENYGSFCWKIQIYARSHNGTTRKMLLPMSKGASVSWAMQLMR